MVEVPQRPEIWHVSDDKRYRHDQSEDARLPLARTHAVKTGATRVEDDADRHPDLKLVCYSGRDPAILGAVAEIAADWPKDIILKELQSHMRMPQVE